MRARQSSRFFNFAESFDRRCLALVHSISDSVKSQIVRDPLATEVKNVSAGWIGHKDLIVDFVNLIGIGYEPACNIDI